MIKILIRDAADHTPVNAPCSRCRSEKQHEVLRSVRQQIDDDMDSIITDYQIVICLTCKTPSFRMQVVDTDLYYFDVEKQDTVTSCVVKAFS